VVVGEETVGSIEAGLCILLGVAATDEPGDPERLAGKIARLRIFEIDAGKFDLNLLETGGEAGCQPVHADRKPERNQAGLLERGFKGTSRAAV
jgi:hypothetical protein